MSAIYIAAIVLAAAAITYVAVRSLRADKSTEGDLAEEILLEEAEIIEAVAPGLEGVAEIRRRGLKPLRFKARATDPSYVFARGSRVRVVDFQDGVGIVEGADEVHVVR